MLSERKNQQVGITPINGQCKRFWFLKILQNLKRGSTPLNVLIRPRSWFSTSTFYRQASLSCERLRLPPIKRHQKPSNANMISLRRLFRTRQIKCRSALRRPQKWRQAARSVACGPHCQWVPVKSAVVCRSFGLLDGLWPLKPIAISLNSGTVGPADGNPVRQRISYGFNESICIHKTSRNKPG